MKLWTTDKKYMWYGASGYHYQVVVSCPQNRQVAAECVRRFYKNRRGVFKEPAADNHLRFSRGKRPWSWFMPSETRQPQVVDITLAQKGEITEVNIDYHVINRFGLLVAPCMFDR